MRSRLVASLAMAIVGTVACSACSGEAEQRVDSNHARGFRAPTVVIDGAEPAYYERATPASFAATSFVTQVLTGTVTHVETVVYEDADVYTAVTVAVDSNNPGEPTTVVTREVGGTTTLGAVRSAFAGHIEASVLDEHANDPITFVDPDQPKHSKVGDHVAVFLGGSARDAGGYFTAAAMTQQTDDSYTWSQEQPPNPGWQDTLSEAKVDKIAAAE